MLFKTIRCIVIFAVLAVPCATLAGPADRSAQIAPYVDEHTLAVAYVDTSRVEPAVVFEELSKLAPTVRVKQQFADTQNAITEQMSFLKDAKAEIYVVFSLIDLPAPGPFVIVALREQANQQKVIDALATSHMEVCEPLNDVVFLGSKATFERVKNANVVARPGLANAFVAGGDAPMQLLIALSADQRRAAAEMLPRLPEALGGGSGRALADVEWAAARVEFAPALSVKVTAQSPSNESALALKSTLSSLLFSLSRNDRVRKSVPSVDELLAAVAPKTNGRRVNVSISTADGNLPQLLKALAGPVGEMQASARRAQSVNNLKQLALAMHIYHDKHKHFPSSASHDENGNELLSWRVHLLPYLEEVELYKQFHLDEPWDSDHNKQLISQMPQVFARPGADLDVPGKTTYLVPTGEAGAFKKDVGIPIRDFIDGTSNTILIVDANQDRAVVWTKPDDIEVNPKKPNDGLGGDHEKTFSAAYADGSVHQLPQDIAAETLRRLLNPRDRKPIPAY